MRRTSPRSRAHAHDIAFHAFLQWQAARGLAAAQRAARGRGMAIGLIADLPVGCDAAGSDAWRDGDAMLRGLSIGAPADPFNARGQAWGVTTWTPTALRARGFAPFVECLRAGFAHAGGVRIDHVLGLARLWVVRDGAPPRDGAYLRYPRDDLLRLAALESFRHRAIVIGEDLGTVPADFRARIAARGIVGLRALWFERDPAGAFRAPGDWDRHAAATSSTHDLPTVAGWWRGVDLGWRWRAAASASACAPASSLSPASDAEAEANAPPARPGESEVAGPDALPPEVRDMRRAERAALWRALQQAGVAARGQKMPPRDAPPVGAILAYVAQAPAPLAIFPLEDLLALEGQPNVPGPPCGHPNWRRRMPRSVDALFDAPARTRIAAVRRARKRAR
ncbi:4-alpha-glucanotransferase [Burkholderia pseudomallei]|nr:4-alpha-glucanotransferase [Burkholderia pseudomallei]